MLFVQDQKPCTDLRAWCACWFLNGFDSDDAFDLRVVALSKHNPMDFFISTPIKPARRFLSFIRWNVRAFVLRKIITSKPPKPTVILSFRRIWIESGVILGCIVASIYRRPRAISWNLMFHFHRPFSVHPLFQSARPPKTYLIAKNYLPDSTPDPNGVIKRSCVMWNRKLSQFNHSRRRRVFRPGRF